MSTQPKLATVQVPGAKIFYREAGSPSAPTVLLLHGFPTSSLQFRNLTPLLAAKGYHVVAPDLPGFGFTEVEDGYKYTFDNIADSIQAFVDKLGLKKFAVYIFDYGAPTGLRLALKNPSQVAAVISQNGNAYKEGFGEGFWGPVEKYWATGAQEDRQALYAATELEATKWQYVDGNPDADQVPPETYHLDVALMARPGNKDIQIDLFYDYRNNITLYPQFHEYFRTSQVPVLAIWGKNDTIFVKAGAEAYAKDVKKFELRLLDTDHFALELNEPLFADEIDSFFKKYQVFN